MKISLQYSLAYILTVTLTVVTADKKWDDFFYNNQGHSFDEKTTVFLSSSSDNKGQAFDDNYGHPFTTT